MLAASRKTEASSNRTRLAVVLRWTLEALILAMTILAPWAFGAVHPASMLILYIALSATLMLWCVSIVVDQGIRLVFCPVLMCIAGMVALGVWQLIPFKQSTLNALSESTASLRSDLYPKQLESLIGEDKVYPPTWTISLDPDATRNRVVQLLALLALFAVVRYAIASPAAFRRLAVACTINGALLSALALAQRFSSSPETIYWIYPSLGSAYGPFVCKNNFPDYVNVCLFLGIGLLLQSPMLKHDGKSIGERIVELGQNPTTLWLIAGVGLMVTGIMFSMSRGGAIALAGGSICCLALAHWTRRFRAGLSLLTLIALLALGTTVWFGVDAVGQRLGTLAGNDPNQSRQELWARTVPLAGRFALWGTGFGTFETVEPLTRKPGDERLLFWEHAHNDYLEALIEGGFINLSLVVLAVAFTIRSGLRAFHRLRDHPDGAMAIGGICGFTAVVLHSFGDFGVHIPAVAVLVTVLLAHLSSLGDTPAPSAYQSSRWLVIPTVVASSIVAVVLPIDGWFRERADHYRLAALRAGNRLPPGERETVIRYLRAAVEFSPDDASIRSRLADAQYEEYLARRNHANATQSVQTELVESHLRPALRNYLCLRATNPLFAQAQARLAGNRQYLQQPDSVQNYLSRATRLRPTDEGLWYLAGLDCLTRGDLNQTWLDWRNSLVCSPTYLASILPVAVARLGPVGAVDLVFPSSPELLYKAALTPPLAEKLNVRREFARRAAVRIAELTLSKKEDLYARAWLLREAGRTADAVVAYEATLLRAPDSVEWRLELAELLFDKRDFKGAEEQIRQVLRERPNLLEARELNKAIVHALAGTH